MINDIYRLDNMSVSIAPEYGCNLFSWIVDGKELLFCPRDFSGNPDDFFSGGNPVLFPSVGRTWDRSSEALMPDIYRIHGKDVFYKMPCHGILPFGAWVKESEEIAEKHIRVEYSFFAPESVLSEYYPFDVSFNLIFTLTRAAIKIKAVFQNTGNDPAPFAFGFHPYFRIADKDNILLHIPAEKRVELDPALLIPTGKKTPTRSNLSLKKGQIYDMAFGCLNGSRASIIDLKTERRIHVDFDENIEMFVVYSGADSEFICLEPWTRGLGAYESLASENWRKTNAVKVLESGETKTITITYSC